MQQQHSTRFSADKLKIAHYKVTKSEITTPENFDDEDIDGYHTDNSFETGFNFEEKLVRVSFTIAIKTQSKPIQEEANCTFEFIYIYQVDELEKFTQKKDDGNSVSLNEDLGFAISSIAYSTSRGILLMKLHGTVFQGFILPVIDPSTLLYNDNEDK